MKTLDEAAAGSEKKAVLNRSRCLKRAGLRAAVPHHARLQPLEPRVADSGASVLQDQRKFFRPAEPLLDRQRFTGRPKGGLKCRRFGRRLDERR